MIRRVGLTACALVLLAVTAVTAQQVVTGTVVRIDQPAGVVVLDNGLMYQTTPQTVFLVNNQPTAFTTIAPGTPVVVQYAQPVVFREGRYVVMAQPAPAATTVVTAPPPTAGVYEISGVVRYVDAVRRTIQFEDGRYVSADENTQVLFNGSPVMLSTVAPGTFVVVRSFKPFAFRGNTYVVASPAPVVMTPAPTVVTGTVVRLDQPNRIILSDGRVIPATAQTVVMVENRAVPVSALQPGTTVVIYPQGQVGVVADPYALPGAVYPEMGLREREAERSSD